MFNRWTSVVAFVLVPLVVACAETTMEAGTATRPPAEREVVVGKTSPPSVYAEVNGNDLTVHLTQETECRPKGAKRTSKGKICGKSRLEGVDVSVKIAGIERHKISNSAGAAVFDLSDFEVSVDESPPRTAKVTLELDSDESDRPTVSLENTPFYGAWEKRRAHSVAVKSLEAAEVTLSGIKTWDDDAIEAYERAEETCTRLATSRLSAPERDRLSAANALIAKLKPKYDKAVADAATRRANLKAAEEARIKKERAAEEARIKKEQAAEEARIKSERAEQGRKLREAAPKAIAFGRAIVLKHLKAPSTAKFVSDEVLLRCSDGWTATRHVVDAQNSFGAILRNNICAYFDGVTGVETGVDEGDCVSQDWCRMMGTRKISP
jgi:hypothetical protein